MIVGNGMIAKKFEKYAMNNDVVIFASGVSNSLEMRNSEYEREEMLLSETMEKNRDKILVYFSTCSMYDSHAKNSAYVVNKLKFENMIKSNMNRYLVVRVSQIIGNARNSTLVNFLVSKIMQGERFEIWKRSTRNLIDVDDVFSAVEYLIDKSGITNEIIHIANHKMISAIELVCLLEKLLDKKASYIELDKGAEYLSIPDDITKYNLPITRKFDDCYLYQVLKKYFGQLTNRGNS